MLCIPQPQGTRELQKKQSSKLPELSQAPIVAPTEKGMFPYSSKASRSTRTTGTGFPPLGSGSRVTEYICNISLKKDAKSMIIC